MSRYEITGCATTSFKLVEMKSALKSCGAKRVSSRNAFGWSNQPKVPTFYAANDTEAGRIADEARAKLAPEGYRYGPSLIPHRY